MISTHDMSGLTGADLPDVLWRKSARSGGNGGSCVEAATLGDVHLARDSKDPLGTVLAFPRDTWSLFLSLVKTGRYDLT